MNENRSGDTTGASDVPVASRPCAAGPARAGDAAADAGPAPAPGGDAPAPAGHEPVPIDLAEQSIAGEEDPGAAFDEDTLPPGGLPGT